MLHHRQLFFIRRGGTYPHFTVELPGVTRNDLTSETEGKVNGNSGLSHACRAGKDNQCIFHVIKNRGRLFLLLCGLGTVKFGEPLLIFGIKEDLVVNDLLVNFVVFIVGNDQVIILLACDASE